VVNHPVSLWRTPRTRALLAVGTIGVAVALVTLAAHVYTNALWFRELGEERVFWTTLKWRLLPPAFVGLGTTCLLLVNFAIVERIAGASVHVGRIVYRLAAIAGGVIGLQLRPAGLSQLLLLWANRSDFGVEDPLFHRDVGFFVFSLPLYQQIVRWLLEMLLITGVATVAAYAVAGQLQAARAHLLALGALLLLVVAWRLRLEQYGLALPHGGAKVPGASYTEAHVRLPSLRILALLSVAGAALCLYGAIWRVRPVLMAVVAALALLTATGASGVSGLIQHFHVAPQELSRERPHITDAIASTRRAFALDRVEIRSRSGGGELTAGDVAENRQTIENVSLWDSGVLQSAMNELQSLGGYYSFPSATVDRYTVDGVPRVMKVAARELDLKRVRKDARTWANERFAYTHGYGIVAVPAGQVDADGYPRFAQRAFRGPLGQTQPRIYYGQRAARAPPYLIVNSTRGEVEEPIPGSEAPGYHYDGPGGIALSSPLRRAAFAARFGDLKLLLTETATSRSRIVLHRDIGARLRALAPFLRWDAQPQTVVVDGRVQFLVQGYTTSDHYPYSAPVRLGDSRVNYVRGSALAAVDAFSGHVTMYADAADPILRAWRGAYPSLFVPLADMPSRLRAHLRYPRQLFAAQAEVYTTYHADDATGFWNGADAWDASRQLAGPVESAGEIHFPDPDQRLDADELGDGNASAKSGWTRPGYLLARLPGDARERFMLATTFTPRGRQNLVGYLAGSVDRGGRPRLTLLSLPRDRLTIGPSQATREVLANPGVVSRLQILNRESRDLGRSSISRTILGVPRVVPLGDALVHVQPVYVTAGGSGLSRLQLVTAYVNGRVGYGRDLEAALRSLLRG
jgi:uncharacterized membrane protein (UPF0182 family)